MNAHNWIIFTHFNTGPDYTVSFLLHRAIPPLYGIKIKFFSVFSLNHTGGSTSAYSYAVRRSTNLYYFHTFLCDFLLYVPLVNLSDTTGEHYWFNPFKYLATR